MTLIAVPPDLMAAVTRRLSIGTGIYAQGRTIRTTIRYVPYLHSHSCCRPKIFLTLILHSVTTTEVRQYAVLKILVTFQIQSFTAAIQLLSSVAVFHIHARGTEMVFITAQVAKSACNRLIMNEACTRSVVLGATYLLLNFQATSQVLLKECRQPRKQDQVHSIVQEA